MTLRTKVFHITDELGNILVDESGNELVANFQINDFGLSARSSAFTLHGYAPAGEYNTGILTYTLVDESGNILVDESGNELVARFPVNTRMLHAGLTETIIHGG